MAEIAVFHLLANLAPFVQQEANLLIGVQEEIEYIRDEFERMTAFLRVADAMEENNPQLKVWVRQVREAAYDIEMFSSCTCFASTSSWRWISRFSS
ncbi:Disease resistance protein PIK6-NP [Camellia lanceoleosa]|uniref:Disease resistance protein PIK6-NP n=1 Tax=Camellia lanceoleosa TaxID=1840588 RepID=A0ACC0HB55_9ERIC|nr:Disease resistance protein PIK6-NP [Camellia lanceoleosa]